MILNAGKPKALIFCKPGYIFDEFYGPLIHRLSAQFRLSLLLTEDFINESIRQILEEYLKDGMIHKYRFIPSFNCSQWAWVYHGKVVTTVKECFKEDIKLLLLSNETFFVHRCLIYYARKKEAWVITLQTDTMVQIRKQYRKQLTNGEYLAKEKVDVLRSVMSLGRQRWESLKRQWRMVCDAYIYPPLHMRTIFWRNHWDRYAFAAGRSDAVICYGHSDMKALQWVMPDLKNVFFACHPSQGKCRCEQGSSLEPKNKLLVTFPSRMNDLDPRRLDRWKTVIKHVVELSRIREVHLRPHPSSIRHKGDWLEKLAFEIQQQGYFCEIMDPMLKSLVSIVCDYKILVGSPSGALRTARFSCENIVIIGIPNSTTGNDLDQEWILEGIEGIQWVDLHEQIEQKHLERTDFKKWKTADFSEVITSMVKENGGMLCTK